jgi:hypothetical protein
MQFTENQRSRQRRNEKREALDDAIRLSWRDTDRQIARAEGVSPTTVAKRRRTLEKRGEILPRAKSGQPSLPCLQRVSILAVEPSPENDTLYDPIREDDPAFLAFVEDIRANSILQPIAVSRDGYIIAGHRRYAAARIIGLTHIPIEIKWNVSRAEDRGGFLRLLASANAQRVKTTAEVVREGIVGMNSDAWQNVQSYRRQASRIDGVQIVRLTGEKKRSEITQKVSLKTAIKNVVFDNKREWPISDRKVFYLLLNVPGLLRNDVLKTPFVNDDDCYQDVTNMVTRMRLNGSIPFESIGDETRPVIIWNTHRSVGTFVGDQLENLFSGYWRDLLQSQPNAVELLVEKNTEATALRRVAAKYTVPMTSGRGYSSLPPRKAMIDRFRASGREKLIVVVVSGFDPEGADIPNAFGLSLRDDFELDEDRLVIVKAALTHQQVQTIDLHEGQLAKDGSSRYRRFVDAYGEHCWELEAIPTDTLREIVEHSIRSVLDLEAFEAELQKQREEQAELNEYRAKVKSALANVERTP